MYAAAGTGARGALAVNCGLVRYPLQLVCMYAVHTARPHMASRCRPPALQSQRQLQLRLEAHGRYITSLLESSELRGTLNLPPAAPASEAPVARETPTSRLGQDFPQQQQQGAQQLGAAAAGGSGTHGGEVPQETTDLLQCGVDSQAQQVQQQQQQPGQTGQQPELQLKQAAVDAAQLQNGLPELLPTLPESGGGQQQTSHAATSQTHFALP